MKQFLLAIDIGTSACKVAIFDRAGTVIASASEPYEVYYPAPGWVEQDPNEWWAAICAAIKKALAEGDVSASDIAAIGIDGQSWSAIPIDRNGEVLRRTPIWMDVRAADICERVKREVGEERIFEVCGNSFSPSYTMPKVLWYKEHEGELYRKIDKILQSNSFIAYKLTGVISQDISQGYGWQCFDMRRGTWDVELCEELGISSTMLPDIYDCSAVVGAVTSEAASVCGLVSGIPVVAGALDAACGALGVGVVRGGETQEQGGQAGGMSICIDEYQADPSLILGYHATSKQWLLQGGTVGGGGVMRWFEQEFADFERLCAKEQGTSSLALLNDIAAEVSAGSDGLVFLPYMSGERSPIWDPKAKGVYYGLDFSKGKGHFVRAAMEGVAFSLRHNLEVAERAGAQVSELRAMGGSANSLLWTQIKADVTGKRIVVPSSDTATTLGAALVAGVGVGLYESFEQAVELTVENRRFHEPNAELKEVYDKNYETYLELYQDLKELMDRE